MCYVFKQYFFVNLHVRLHRDYNLSINPFQQRKIIAAAAAVSFNVFRR